MIAGPSLGGLLCQPLFSSTTVSSAFASANRFSPLATILPEYSQLLELDVTVSFLDGRHATASALLDCRAQGSLINNKFVQLYTIPLKPKPKPMILRLADGQTSHNKDLTQYAPVQLQLQDHHEHIALDVSTITHDIILGLPWFEKHNPTIDWETRTLSFDSDQCKAHISPRNHSTPQQTKSERN